jgi:hypothetical protein
MLFERLRIKGSNGKAKNAWARSVRRLDLILVALLWIGSAAGRRRGGRAGACAMPSDHGVHEFLGGKIWHYSAEGLTYPFL